MDTKRLACLTAIALLATAAHLPANPPPDPISIDAASPSLALCTTPKFAADLYGLMGGVIGQGCDVNPPAGPILHVPHFNYGLTPTDDNDGHSNGERDPFAQVAVYFSGDRPSRGAPGTDYRTQAVNNQAAGDRFVTNGLTIQSPAGAFAACSPTAIGPAWFPGRPLNLLSVNQDRYNEIPSIRPWVANPGNKIDDLDAVELFLFDQNGDQVHDTPIYFTVAPGSGAPPADVLLSPPGTPGFFVFAPAAALGLRPGDNVDALAVWDLVNPHQVDPGRDYAIFSLDPASPSLGGFSPADIFVTDFSGVFCRFLTAGGIGMLTTDNVDAVDVEIGEVEVFEEPVASP